MKAQKNMAQKITAKKQKARQPDKKAAFRSSGAKSKKIFNIQSLPAVRCAPNISEASGAENITKQNEFFKPKKIKVRIVGIGGGGCAMISEIFPLVRLATFVGADTDVRTAKKIKRGVKFFQFGQNITHGMGTGMDVALAQKAALEDKEKIKQIFENQDICFLVGCLGGGVGSGAAPVFAQAAKEAHCISIGFFTLPFEFEGEKKVRMAKKAVDEITEHLSGIMVVPNERIFQISEKKLSLPKAFSTLNQMLALSLKELLDVVFTPGLINIDFADLRAILKERGNILFFSQAQSMGPNRADEVAKKIFQNSLSLQPPKNIKRILFNISAGKDLKLKEVELISETIALLNPKAKIIFAVSPKNSLEGKIKLLLLAVCAPEHLKSHFHTEKKAQKKTKVLGAKGNKKEAAKKIIKKKPLVKTGQKTKQKEVLPDISLQTPSISPIRKTALEVQKEAEEATKKELAGNTNWDIPAFWREKLKE